MDNEEIIRSEAQKLFNYQLDSSSKQTDELVNIIRGKLTDFYPSENKAIFLDELKRLINQQLLEHRNKHHEGNPGKDCDYEKRRDVILFYINQEIDTFPKVVHQKHSSSPNKRNKVFVSYCHSDKDFLNDVKRHFKPFLKDIDFWDDTRIQPGQKWKEEIEKAIKETKIAIILLSTDFMGSEFISTNELPPLLEAAEKDGATILIVILKPCLFEAFEDLNKYQAMNPPNRTVLSMGYEEREELWVNLVRQTKKILKK
jgi:hypothetical protein